jgi:hypothetical protein
MSLPTTPFFINARAASDFTGRAVIHTKYHIGWSQHWGGLWKPAEQRRDVMNTLVAKIVEMSKKLGYFALQYGYVALYWMLKLYKVRMQKWHGSGAQKQLQKSYSALGAEIYALYRSRPESEWQKESAVRQQLQQVEESEAQVMRADGVLEQINSDFVAKKEELRTKYAAKRAETGSAGSQGDTM